MLWHLYSTLEAALDQHSTHPALVSTYNPRLLSRTQSLSNDISHFLQVPSSDPSVWQQHPLYQSFLPIPKDLSDYLDHINRITTSPDPTLLLSHAYVRYLGDLSGGQIIKRILLKAYDASFLTFYDFGKLDGSVAGNDIAASGDVLKLKTWFKSGMDADVVEEEKKRAVVDEANLALILSSRILALLKPLPQADDNTSLTAADTRGIAGFEEETISALVTIGTIILALILSHLFFAIGGNLFGKTRGNMTCQWMFHTIDACIRILSGNTKGTASQ